jgi:hypothetical protein
MSLTRKSVETLIDLVEIKLSCIEVFDGQDGQTVNRLEQCRKELYGLVGKEPPRDERLTLGGPAAA